MTYRKPGRPDLNNIPGDELAALTAIAKAGGESVKESLYRYVLLRAKRAGKRKHDQPLDCKRRILVGARLPREEAWLIARAANIQGVSLYSFCRNALTEKAKEITGYSPTESVYIH